MGTFIIKRTSTGVMFNLKAGNGEIIASSEVYSSRSACEKGVESVRKNAVAAKVEDQTVDGYTPLTNPKFEIYLDEGGRFRFRLKAQNGGLLIYSEGYTAKANCKNGIDSVRRNAPDATVNIIE